MILAFIDADFLRRFAEIASGRAVGIDNPLAEQVPDLLPGFGLIGSVEIVEGVVFTDHNDHMFDRRGGRGGERGIGRQAWRNGGGHGRHHHQFFGKLHRMFPRK